MKKILSIFLIAAILFTLSTSFLTIMADEEISGDVTFFTTIGIFPEDAEDDTVLTRIQLAEVFYNIVFPDKSVSEELWGECGFLDVPEDKKHIVATAAGLGAMRGYSESTFGPDDAVTYVQSIKAIVSFLGYDLQAQNMGGYPSGYLAQASRLQILPAGNTPGDTQATYAAVATILKKAINKDIAIWNYTTTDGEAIQEILEGTDYLKFYRGINITRGTVTGNYLTNLKSGSNTNFFGIYINGYEMEVAKTAHGIQELLGYDVYVYYTDVDGVKTAIYYELGTNNVIKIDAGDILSVTKSGIKYYQDGYDTPFSADFSQKAVLIYNGTSEASFTPADVNPFGTNNLDGYVKLIDTDGDGAFETITVTAFKTIVVKDVLNNKIYGEYDMSGNGDDKLIDISNYKDGSINIRNINGVKVEPSGISKGVVLNVCYDKNGVVKEIIGSRDTMTGIIEEISYDGSKISAVKMSGAEFKASSGLVLFDSANKLKPGVTATVFFNCNANVAVIDLEKNYTDGYSTAYLVDAGIEGSLEKKVLCMVFDSTGEMNTYNLAERVVFNGVPKSAEDVLGGFGKEGKRVKRQLILYKANLEGDTITVIETPTKLAKDDDAFNGFYEFPGTSHYYSGGHRTIDDKYLANNNTICFAVPSEADRDRYEFYSMTSLPNGEEYKIGTVDSPRTDMQIFGMKEEALSVSHVILSSSYASSGSGLDKRPLFVVSKVATAIDDKGESKLKVTGVYIQGTTLYDGSFYINPELLVTGHERGLPTNVVATGTRPFIDQTETMPEPGDIFKLPYFENNGEIETMNCAQFYQLYDIGSDTFMENGGTGYSVDRSSAGTFHYFGYVLYNDLTSVKTVLGNEVAPEVPKYKAYEFSSGYYKFIEVTKRASDGQVTVSKSTFNSIRAERTFPGMGSRVLTLLRGAGIGCVVLNFR